MRKLTQRYFHCLLFTILWFNVSCVENKCANLNIKEPTGRRVISVGDRDILNVKNEKLLAGQWTKLHKMSFASSVDVKANCYFRICYKYQKRELLHQKCNDIMKSTEFTIGSNFSSLKYNWNGNISNVLSLDCSCKEEKEESCKSAATCLSVKPAENLCAIVYQETNCLSCRFDPIYIPYYPFKRFRISGLSRISSIALRDGCNVYAYGISTVDGKSIENKYDKQDDQKLFLDINKYAYNITNFWCMCNNSNDTRYLEDIPKAISNVSTENIFLALGSVVAIAIFACILILVRNKIKSWYTKEEKGLSALPGLLELESLQELEATTTVDVYEPQCIRIVRVLGGGHFGTVYEGLLQTKSGALESVAIKCEKLSDNPIYLICIRKEIRIMESVAEHLNIVKTIGACFKCDEIRCPGFSRGPTLGKTCLIMELCEGGSLKMFLERNRRYFIDLLQWETRPSYVQMAEDSGGLEDGKVLSTVTLLQWAYGVACGMAYLCNKQIVHLDLALRNTLLTKDWTVKIADFGISKILHGSPYYSLYRNGQTPIPALCLPPETLISGQVTLKADIWSFGNFLWELFSLGLNLRMEDSSPSDRFIERDRIAIANKFLGGYRFKKPVNASEKIYEKMLNCWGINPEGRPSFMDLQDFFTDEIKIMENLSLPHTKILIQPE